MKAIVKGLCWLHLVTSTPICQDEACDDTSMLQKLPDVSEKPMGSLLSNDMSKKKRRNFKGKDEPEEKGEDVEEKVEEKDDDAEDKADEDKGTLAKGKAKGKDDGTPDDGTPQKGKDKGKGKGKGKGKHKGKHNGAGMDDKEEADKKEDGEKIPTSLLMYLLPPWPPLATYNTTVFSCFFLYCGPPPS